VHEKARQASIIMSTTQIAQVRNCIVCCICVVSHNYQYFIIACKVADRPSSYTTALAIH